MKNFELTITVNPKKKSIGGTTYGTAYGRMSAKEQWNILSEKVSGLLQLYEYRLVPEFHNNLNIHMHAHVMVREDIDNSVINFLKKDFEVLFGRTSFTEINNLDSWIRYMDKDQDETLKKIQKVSMYYFPQFEGEKRGDSATAK